MSTELLDQAIMTEGESMFEEMEALLGAVKEAGGYVPAEIDELTIRRMMIRIKMNEREIKKNKQLRDAIKETWDKRIKGKEEESEQLRKVIDRWIHEKNNSKPLQLDVGTAGVRKVPHNFNIKDQILFRTWLEARGKLNDFLLPQALDVTAAKDDIISWIDKTAGEKADKDLEKLIADNPDKKYTKAELKRRKDEFIAGYVPQLVAEVGLPETVADYKPESQSISLRFA